MTTNPQDARRERIWQAAMKMWLTPQEFSSFEECLATATKLHDAFFGPSDAPPEPPAAPVDSRLVELIRNTLATARQNREQAMSDHTRNFFEGEATALRNLLDDIAEVLGAESPPADTDAALDAVKNLLARIHRDGGHHTESVGMETSIADAEAVVVGFLRDKANLADLTEQLAAAEARAEKLDANLCDLTADLICAERDNDAAEVRVATLAKAVKEAIDNLEAIATEVAHPYRHRAVATETAGLRAALRDAGVET